MRKSMIELALAVVPTSDHRIDFTRARVERDQRHLRLRYRLGAALLGILAPPLVVLLREKQVHVFHPCIDRRNGGALQRGIERGVNPEILAQQFVLGEFVEEMVLDHVHEVRRVAAGDRSAHDFQGCTFRILYVRLVDVLVLQHLRQDAVPRLAPAFGMPVRGRIEVWRANDAGKVSALSQR